MVPRPLLLAMALCAGCGFDLVPAGTTDARRAVDDVPVGGDAATDATDAPPIDAPAPCVWSAWGTPQAIVQLNSGALDSRPRLTADELVVVFYSTRGGGAGDRDLYIAKRASVGQPFSSPVNITELNTASSDRDPALSADGLTLVFTSTRLGGSGDHDVWMATRSSATAAFSAPQPVVAVNSIGLEYFTAMSADARTIYFCSNRPIGSAGAYDVWFSTRASTASSFLTVQNLTAINSAADEYQVLVSPDELEIYFSTDRAGPIEIWVTRRANASSPFGAATPVTELNFVGEQHPGWMSPDGRRLYYSHQGTGVSQIYVTSRTCL